VRTGRGEGAARPGHAVGSMGALLGQVRAMHRQATGLGREVLRRRGEEREGSGQTCRGEEEREGLLQCGNREEN
jgi:hypothetical protein